MPRPKGLAKQRPQKKLVQSIEAAPAVVLSTEEENASGAPVVLAAAAPLAPAPCAAVSSSPDRKRVEEALVFADASCERAEKELKHLKAKEKVAERLYEAKMRRADGVNRKRKLKNPFGVVCRRYEAIIEFDQAQLKRERAEVRALEAKSAGYALLIDLLERENARLRR